MQKEGESLWEFIQHFWNKTNIIPKVDNKSIIMFFKKGLKDLALICKLARKNPRTSEEMLAITNKYALAEEATLDNREAKKDKKPNHMDRPGTSKPNDKKTKHDHSVTNMERPHHNRIEYRPWSGEYEGFLDGIYIFHRQGKDKIWDCNRLQGFADESSKRPKKSSKKRRQKTQRVTSVRLTRRTITSSVDPTPMSPRERKSSLHRRSEVPITFD
jgi:hypothetical protein